MMAEQSSNVVVDKKEGPPQAILPAAAIPANVPVADSLTRGEDNLLALGPPRLLDHQLSRKTGQLSRSTGGSESMGEAVMAANVPISDPGGASKATTTEAPGVTNPPSSAQKPQETSESTKPILKGKKPNFADLVRKATAVADAAASITNQPNTGKSSGKSKMKKSKADLLLGKTPEIQLVMSADRGILSDVIGALDDGADINFKLDGRTTALCRAVHRYHFPIAQLLLQRRADPFVTEHDQKSVFYYVLFSENVPSEEAQLDMLRLLLEYVPYPTPEIVIMASYFAATRPRVTIEVFGRLSFRLISKDANDWCLFEASGLELLDDPSCNFQWPDGSWSSGTTALHVLTERCKSRKDLMSHPVVKALLLWKKRTYGRRIEIIEWLILIVMIGSTTLTAVLFTMANSHVTDYGQHVDILRILFECIRFISVTVNTTEDVAVGYGITPSYVRNFIAAKRAGDPPPARRGSSSIRGLIFPLSIWILVITSSILRFIDLDSPSIEAVLVVAIYLRSIHYLQLVEAIGPLFIMMEDIIQHDVLMFCSLVAVNVPGFAIALYITHQDGINGESPWSLWDTVFHLLVSMSGLDPNVAIRVHGYFAGTLVLVFTVMVPLLSLNLLIAMMNHTYIRVQRTSAQEYMLRQAKYLTTREVLAKSPHFAKQPSQPSALSANMTLLTPSGRPRSVYQFHGYEEKFKELVLYSGDDEMQQLETIIELFDSVKTDIEQYKAADAKNIQDRESMAKSNSAVDSKIMFLLQCICETVMSDSQLAFIESKAPRHDAAEVGRSGFAPPADAATTGLISTLSSDKQTANTPPALGLSAANRDDNISTDGFPMSTHMPKLSEQKRRSSTAPHAELSIPEGRSSTANDLSLSSTSPGPSKVTGPTTAARRLSSVSQNRDTEISSQGGLGALTVGGGASSHNVSSATSSHTSKQSRRLSQRSTKVAPAADGRQESGTEETERKAAQDNVDRIIRRLSRRMSSSSSLLDRGPRSGLDIGNAGIIATEAPLQPMGGDSPAYMPLETPAQQLMDGSAQ